jgi:glycosyltransferase involved in cell wall biosynthesis
MSGVQPPMRILHLINHCGKANGHVNVSVDMACTQAANGHNVGYMSSGGDYIGLLQSYGVEIFMAPQPHRSLKAFWSAAAAIYRGVRTFQPDVIHVHMAAQIVMAQPLRLLGYKVVSTIHNEFDRSVWLMGLASRVVAVSKAGCDAMLKRGFSKNALRVVVNGTIGSPRLAATFQAAELMHPAIVTVCGLHHRKGVADLINAFRFVSDAVPAAHLYILGEGPSQAEYENLVFALGLSNTVHFLGYHADPREYLFPADIFVLASHADPGPLVIAEARNAGCAIVATNVDGIPEMLDCGAAGLLVEPRQPAQLSRAILQLLENKDELTCYSDRARKNSERFTIGRVCREMDQVYAEITTVPVR